MNIAICNPNRAFCNFARKTIIEKLSVLSIKLKVSIFPDAESFISQHALFRFDVAFIDMALPDISGLELASALKNLTPSIQIVFICSDNELVHECFNFDPIHFIPKTDTPSVKKHLCIAADIIYQTFNGLENIFLTLAYGETVTVCPSDIMYLESRANYTHYFLVNGESFRVRQKLCEALVGVNCSDVFRIHKSFAVNLGNIKSIDFQTAQITLVDDSIIYFSCTYKRRLEQIYKIYLDTK